MSASSPTKMQTATHPCTTDTSVWVGSLTDLACGKILTARCPAGLSENCQVKPNQSLQSKSQRMPPTPGSIKTTSRFDQTPCYLEPKAH